MTRLDFEVDWTESADLDPRRAGTSAELRILVGGLSIMRQYSKWSRTITDKARVPIYPIAEWFAANWWRIRYEAPYESGAETPVDWHLSHDLVGIGGGFVWPKIIFSSDDRAVQILTKPSDSAAWEPVQYFPVPVVTELSHVDFDQAVDKLVGLVVARLEDLGTSPEPLATTWSHVLAERRDHEVAEWRRWEARLGYDPDEAPDGLMSATVQALEGAGQNATYEILPLLGRDKSLSLQDLQFILVEPGIDAKMPAGFDLSARTVDDRPWEIGYNLAKQVRERIGRPKGPLRNKALGDLLGIDAATLRQSVSSSRPLGLGVRDRASGRASLHFRKRHVRARRFEAARFLAEGLTFPDDAWMPVTDRGTARQKLQRAFAAELLAPINDLQDFLGDDRSDEKLDEASDVYEVSAYAVRSQLVNHGLLARGNVAA